MPKIKSHKSIEIQDPPSDGKKRFTNYMYTLHNYTPEMIEKKLIPIVCDYHIAGHEICPKTNRPHLQGFIYWKNKKSWTAAKAHFPNWVHIEKCKLSAITNINYASKDGKLALETGKKPPGQGSRTDIHEIHSALVDDGKSADDVMIEYPISIKYHRGIDRVYEAVSRRKFNTFRDVKVFILYGAAGSGKTRSVYEADPAVYSPTYTSTGLWWNGYQGQSTILFDDFYGGICKYSSLLRFLDGHPLQLPTKGGMVSAGYTTVYLTSNVHPKHWYTQGISKALQRRITEIKDFDLLVPDPKLP